MLSFSCFLLAFTVKQLGPKETLKELSGFTKSGSFGTRTLALSKEKYSSFPDFDLFWPFFEWKNGSRSENLAFQFSEFDLLSWGLEGIGGSVVQ